MKFFIKELTDVEEQYRALYKKVEGGYQLNVDVSESAEFKAVLNNKNEILEEKRKLKAELDEAEAKRKKEDDEKAAANAQSREEFEKVLATERATHATEIAKLQGVADKRFDQLKESLLNSTIDTVSLELAGDDAAILKPHVGTRLDIEEVDGVVKLIVKDKAGNKSTMTVEQLVDEIKEDKTFAAVVKGRESGGGGSQNKGGGGGADIEKFYDPKHVEYSLTKQCEIEDKNPALHAELLAKFKII